jgi:ribonuclease Z
VKIIFLGTNGWFDTYTGETPCILIDSDCAYIILDAGNGIHKLDRYITDTKKPIFLFLSHLHLDHISGLHILNKFRFSQGMTICVPKGLGSPLKAFMREPYTVSLENLHTKVAMLELSEGEHTIPYPVTCIPLFHSSLNFGYRFTIDKKIIAYSGDTGICEKSFDFAKDADVLIHECSFEPGHQKSPWGHSTPEEAAQLAKDAHVHTLLLTHFDARIYSTIEQRKDAEKVAQKIFSNSTAMRDDQTIVLS